MSWTEKTRISSTAAERLVHQSVSARRWQGIKAEHAMADAALALGTTPRRIRSLIRGEIFRVARAEYQRLRARFRADMTRQAAELHARANTLEQQAEAEWLAEHQLELALEAECSETSSRVSVFGVRGGR